MKLQPLIIKSLCNFFPLNRAQDDHHFMASSDVQRWPSLLSDPTLFSELLEFLQKRGEVVVQSSGLAKDDKLQFDDVYVLEPEHLPGSGDTLALLFLFELNPKSCQRYELCSPSEQADKCQNQHPWHIKPASASTFPKLATKDQYEGADIRFMYQRVQNACGIIALLHCLANIPGFKVEALNSLDPETNRRAFEQSPAIKDGVYHLVETRGLEDNSLCEPATHYVTFVFKQDHLWELDGRQVAPIDHGRCTKKDWIQLAFQVIKEVTCLDPSNPLVSVLSVHN